jgi:hypothetical protein
MTKRKPTTDEITEANQAVSRGEGRKGKSRASRRLSAAVPAARLGAELQAEDHEAGETEAALRRATNLPERRD